ncbi:MAG TPA: FKBP-type peptidyl-prolyl cis-trans isomerase [Bacteroidia bacterium]|nr:FKBP-type peptidyl-prolyl cis-trans isomerase [Bacteroidia bacterium]
MMRFLALPCSILAAAFLVSCSSDGGPVSPTVNPASPAQTGAAPAPSGVQTTYSGLKYEVLRAGSGARPSSYNRVKVHYHGYLPNGTVFDSSVQRGQPAEFPLNKVIAGWQEGIPLMQVGSKYRFTVPPHLAYGAAGMPPKIGPNQTLMFDVELLEILY